MKKVNKGFFISVEGTEGAGKSTFCRGLKNYFEKMGHEVKVTFEPGNTPIAKKIRELFLNPPKGDPLTAKSELFLIMAARVQNICENINPSLEKNQIVICDRFLDSTLLYQGVLGGISFEKIIEFNLFATEGRLPDITFLLDLPVSEAIARVKLRSKIDNEIIENRYDSALPSQYSLYKKGFEQIYQRFPKRIKKLDATKNPEEIVESSLKYLPSCYTKNKFS